MTENALGRRRTKGSLPRRIGSRTILGEPRAHTHDMLPELIIAAALVAVTAALHSIGFGLLLGRLAKTPAPPPQRSWPIAWLLVRIAWLLILIHTAEITVWAVFYRWQHC